jgi:hypothetical protein
MPDANLRVHQWVLKGKATPEQKTHEIIPPIRFDVIDFLNEAAATVDTVPGHICTDIRSWCELPGFWVASVQDFEERTRTGIALAKKEKVVSKRTGNNHQIGLSIARRQARGWRAPLTSTNALTELWRCETGQIMHSVFDRCHKTFLTGEHNALRYKKQLMNSP